MSAPSRHIGKIGGKGAGFGSAAAEFAPVVRGGGARLDTLLDEPRMQAFRGKSASNPVNIIAGFTENSKDARAYFREGAGQELMEAMRTQALAVLREVAERRLRYVSAIQARARPICDSPDLLRLVSNYVFLLDKVVKAPPEQRAEAAKDLDGRWQELEAVNSVITLVNEWEKAQLLALARERELCRNAEIEKFINFAKNKVQDVARRSEPFYDDSGSTLICNMVAVVIDLSTGHWEEGRAGHGHTADEFDALLGKAVPRASVNAFIAQNPVNCAEWGALYKLLQNWPDTDRSQLYFAAAVPGRQGKIIPPCENCKRLMNMLGANAHGYKGKS
jgi:hypothetical protein